MEFRLNKESEKWDVHYMVELQDRAKFSIFSASLSNVYYLYSSIHERINEKSRIEKDIEEYIYHKY